MGWNYKVTKRRKVVEERECVNVTCDLCDKEMSLEPFWHWPYRACEVSLGSRKEGYTHDTHYELLICESCADTATVKRLYQRAVERNLKWKTQR